MKLATSNKTADQNFAYEPTMMFVLKVLTQEDQAEELHILDLEHKWYADFDQTWTWINDQPALSLSAVLLYFAAALEPVIKS